jgi:hypothetical protein
MLNATPPRYKIAQHKPNIHTCAEKANATVKTLFGTIMERWIHEARVIAQLVIGGGGYGREAGASFSSFMVDIWGCRHCLFY